MTNLPWWLRVTDQSLTYYEVKVLGEPAPWAVYTRRGAPSANFLACQVWQEQIRAAVIEKYGRPMLMGPVTLEAVFHRTLRNPPKTAAAYQRRCLAEIVRPPDVTNLTKAAEDALKGVLIKDDGQVIKVTGQKRFVPQGGKPWTWLAVAVVDPRWLETSALEETECGGELPNSGVLE